MQTSELIKPLRIQTARVFRPLLDPSRFKAAYGGRGSGKSYFFAELLIERALMEPGLRAVCIRETQRSLDQSSKRLVEDKIASLGLGSLFEVRKAEIGTPGGGMIIFEGMQNHTSQSLKSLEGYSIAWVDEAQALSQTSLDLLRPTIRKKGSELWFSWNPTNPKDPVDAMFRGVPPPNSIIVKANYSENPWLRDNNPELFDEMEWDKRRDPDKYRHIWLGEYQTHSEARVFHNWKIEEFPDPPRDTRFYFGCDWGFSVDPTVLVRCYLDGRKLYVDREAWKVKLELDKTPAFFRETIPGCDKWSIKADSSNPQSISYMNRFGFKLAPSVKGPGSVDEGVEFLKSQDIIVHPRCTHVIDELSCYSYEVDRQTGEVLPKLADKKNHTIDALRYALEGVRRAPAMPVFGTWGRD